MPFACIFVPDFPVESLVRVEPELRSQSLAVLEGKAPLQKVFAMNENARRAGVSPGMSKLQIEACAGLVFRARSLSQEAAAHATLLDCAQSFSPRVEDLDCDTILLDLAGLQPLFGPLPKIARALARRASDLGLKTSVAVAGNPDTAALAARGFSGVTVIPEGKEAEQLGSLAVEVLFGNLAQDSVQLLETFSRWGIRKLRDLAALPDVALSERVGQAGIHLQKLARGATSRTLVPVEPALVFEEVIELEYPLVLLEPLAFLLGRLLEQLCARLEARALATQELRLDLELQNGYQSDESAEPAFSPSSHGRFSRTLRIPVPLLDWRTFLKLLQLDLKAHPPGAPIVKIRLAVEPVRPRAAQSGLFLPPTPEPEKLELTLARIAGIVGDDKVGSLELLDTHRPEGFRMRRFAPSEPQGLKLFYKSTVNAGLKPCSTVDARNSNARNLNTQKLDAQNIDVQNRDVQNIDAHCDLVTALRIFRPPVDVTVTIQDGRPARITCPKRKEMQGEILWAAGPWRSSGDWWEQEGWARDEWDIAVQGETGIALYRLVRDRIGGRWILEGSYD
ncbi:MAG TPA: DNA polymerase Y family protein [Terriglobales bacterium]|nr:DNA polymerase Y family protein [Terriglobales bacterium]